MRVLSHTIWIARTPGEVFDFFIDFSQASRWRQFVRTMTPLEDGQLRPGSRIRVTLDIMGTLSEFDLEVLAYERPALWRHRTNEVDFAGFVEYRFQPEANGTRVTMTMVAKPVGLYGWLAMPLLLFGRKRRYRDQLPQLKRELEPRL